MFMYHSQLNLCNTGRPVVHLWHCLVCCSAVYTINLDEVRSVASGCCKEILAFVQELDVKVITVTFFILIPYLIDVRTFDDDSPHLLRCFRSLGQGRG